MRPDRSTLLTAAVLAAVFVAGGFSGAALMTWTGGSGTDAAGGAEARPGAVESTGPEGHGDGDRDDEPRKGPVYDISRFLHAELDLTREQERRVEAILERRRRRAGEIFEATKERLRSQLDSTVTELKVVLTAGQGAELDSLLERRRREWRERHGEEDAPERR